MVDVEGLSGERGVFKGALEALLPDVGLLLSYLNSARGVLGGLGVFTGALEALLIGVSVECGDLRELEGEGRVWGLKRVEEVGGVWGLGGMGTWEGSVCWECWNHPVS